MSSSPSLYPLSCTHAHTRRTLVRMHAACTHTRTHAHTHRILACTHVHSMHARTHVCTRRILAQRMHVRTHTQNTRTHSSQLSPKAFVVNISLSATRLVCCSLRHFSSSITALPLVSRNPARGGGEGGWRGWRGGTSTEPAGHRRPLAWHACRQLVYSMYIYRQLMCM